MGSRLQLPELFTCHFPRTLNTFRIQQEQAVLDYPSVNTSGALQPASPWCSAGTALLLWADCGSTAPAGKCCCALQRFWPGQQRLLNNAYHFFSCMKGYTSVGLFQGCFCSPDLKGTIPLVTLCARSIPGDQKPACSSGLPQLSNIFQREMKNPPNKYGKKHSHDTIKK